MQISMIPKPFSRSMVPKQKHQTDRYFEDFHNPVPELGSTFYTRRANFKHNTQRPAHKSSFVSIHTPNYARDQKEMNVAGVEEEESH
jgi:hypothetical protein